MDEYIYKDLVRHPEYPNSFGCDDHEGCDIEVNNMVHLAEHPGVAIFRDEELYYRQYYFIRPHPAEECSCKGLQFCWTPNDIERGTRQMVVRAYARAKELNSIAADKIMCYLLSSK